MGFGRFVKHILMPETIVVDLVKNMVDEGGVIDGYKKTIKQMNTEDDPLVAMIYKSGKYDGKIEGYVEASDEYEKKLLGQADEFLKQRKDFEKERDEYEALVNAYEQEIEVLENKVDRTQAENDLLQQLLIRERNLIKLARG